MRVKVTGYFTPDEEDVDETSPTGLTEAGFEALDNVMLGDLEGLRAVAE